MRAKLHLTHCPIFPPPKSPLRRNLCIHLRTISNPHPFPWAPLRTLVTHLFRKQTSGKQSSKPTSPLNAQKTASLDPFDYTSYDAQISRIQEILRSQLARVKAGNYDPGVIEDVRVKLPGAKGGGGNGGKGTTTGGTVRVGDIASVVRRGRNVGVLVGEMDHIRPITSTLSLPPLSLHPTPSPTDPLHLTISIPPPTTESRQATLTLGRTKEHEALFAVREARGTQRKTLRAMQLGRQVGPDELRRAEADLEKRNEKVVGEVKRVVEGWMKAMEGG